MKSIARKQLRERALAIALCAALVFLCIPTGATAAAKYKSPVKIKTNTVKKIDINGGKKEKVQLVRHKKGADGPYDMPIVEFTLKINGKAYKTFIEDGISSAWSLYYVDLNKKDKYKELIVKGSESDGVEIGSNYYIFRYKNGKLVPIKASFKYKIPENDYGYEEKLNKSPFVKGLAMRTYGNGIFKMKYYYDYSGERYKWVTLKIDSKMNVKKVK